MRLSILAAAASTNQKNVHSVVSESPATVLVVILGVPDHALPLPSRTTKWLSGVLSAVLPLIFRVSTGVLVPRGCTFMYHLLAEGETKEMASPGHSTNFHSMSQRPSPDMEKSRSPSAHSGHLGKVKDGREKGQGGTNCMSAVRKTPSRTYSSTSWVLMETLAHGSRSVVFLALRGYSLVGDEGLETRRDWVPAVTLSAGRSFDACAAHQRVAILSTVEGNCTQGG